MLSKLFRPTLLTSLFCAAVLFGIACDKTPDTTSESVENLQTEKSPPADAPKVSETVKANDKKPAENVRTGTAALRDQFQQEAANSINIENAEKVLSEIEQELNEELAELERDTPPTPAN